MINILCDNKNFVVCEKPSGLISELSDDHNISLPAILSKQLGDTELFTVHRLDKDVSGIIVYAKNQQTATKLSNQISENKFEKEYVAIVSKKVNPEEMELCHLLYHDRAKNKTYTVKRKRNGVKEAKLKYKLLSYNVEQDISTLLIKLYTGRTHQIRVQLATIGHSICGDKKYGSQISVKPIRLHSFYLSFYDPQTSEKECFISTPEWIDDITRINLNNHESIYFN